MTSPQEPTSRSAVISTVAVAAALVVLALLASIPSVWHVWFPVQHWLSVHTGTVNEPGPYYGFFSGFGSDLGELTLIGGVLAIYKKHNCHARWCFRFGHHDFLDPETGVTYKLCRHCHPAHPGRKPLTRAYFRGIHARNS